MIHPGTIMPLEIRELTIKAVVSEERNAPTENTSETISAALDKQAIISACVDQVLEILKEKLEK